MKNLIVSACFILLVKVLSAQSLTGVWQEQTPDVSSGYLNTYSFPDDSTILFKPNTYFGLKRIVSLEGKYKFDKTKNLLYVTILYTNEIVGGTIERSKEEGTATDLWAIEGGQEKKIKLPKPVKATISIEFKKSDKDAQLMLLDKKKYYKVE